MIPSYEIFKQPPGALLADPRCLYDAQTGRWFLTEFIFGTAAAPTSTQFIAVSNTSDPTGTYTIWAINNTDRGTKGCPCFGDYDQLGMDNNGVYITTDEFSNTGPAFNGVIVYAISKQELETFSSSKIPPVPVAYRITKDQFGQPILHRQPRPRPVPRLPPTRNTSSSPTATPSPIITWSSTRSTTPRC